MEMYTILFWISSLLFIGLSVYLLRSKRGCPILNAQIAAGCAMFITSKIGRKFLGLD
jgi:hypothetical protein